VPEKENGARDGSGGDWGIFRGEGWKNAGCLYSLSDEEGIKRS